MHRHIAIVDLLSLKRAANHSSHPPLPFARCALACPAPSRLGLFASFPSFPFIAQCCVCLSGWLCYRHHSRAPCSRNPTYPSIQRTHATTPPLVTIINTPYILIAVHHSALSQGPSSPQRWEYATPCRGSKAMQTSTFPHKTILLNSGSCRRAQQRLHDADPGIPAPLDRTLHKSLHKFFHDG